ncbi:hypothetical protein [Methylotuvimicrobium sp. KM2]|uniref:hypothetical protein n=1 Tax=Methylotuvimicrobium sp. KM2 TaxID=3133976 RepID=UPI0031011DAA
MQLMLNDLSLHGQFQNISDFQNAIRSLMSIRSKIKQFGYEIYCHRNVTQAQITHQLTMQQAIQKFDQNERRSVMGWLTQHGPFWEDEPHHASDDYLEYQDQVVTDTALGEAAYRCINGSESQLVSLLPSDWIFTPINVILHNDTVTNIDVLNHWEINTIEAALRDSFPPIQSWEQLASIMPDRCSNLIFSSDSFEPLKGHPFVNGAAKRIVELLETLDKFKTYFDAQGQRTVEGQRIYQDHFTGKKAWFTDSSPSEKNEFNNELTFKHPSKHTETLFCTWHGKIKTPQLRIHFSWPISKSEPLYVVYIGPKLTKQ